MLCKLTCGTWTVNSLLPFGLPQQLAFLVP